MGFHLWSYALDLFTLLHAAGWAAGGFLAARRWRLSLLAVVVLALLGGVGWELLELGVVEHLLHFHEPIWNRWLTDPLADLLGAWLGAWWARRATGGRGAAAAPPGAAAARSAASLH